MTTFYSDEMTDILAVPPVAISPVEHHGKVRIAHVNYTQVADGSAADVLELCRLPAGRVRLIGRLSSLYHNLTSASEKLDIGWAAYTDLDDAAVAADPNGLDNQIDVETAGTINIGTVAAVLAVGGNHLFESQEGVVLNCTFTVKPLASDSIVGFVAYVAD